ncbi:MAG: hypothetical protein WBQ23_07015 [Bacteroidota bacterium]
MMKRWLMPLFLAVLPMLVVLPGCSSDDNNPTDPNKGYHQIDIRLHAGDQFAYDRWDLDQSQQKIESTKRKYDVEFMNGVGLIGQYNDWFFRIGKDRSTNARDTLIIRMESRTRDNQTSYTKQVMAYGFMYQALQQFIALVMPLGTVGVPTIPAENWDVVADFYDETGTARDPGYEWPIGPAAGVPMNFTINGAQLPVTAKMTGKYEAREEIITANNKQIKTWKSSITASFNLLGSVDLKVKINVWFSDDPGTIVKMVQESTETTIPILNLPFTVDGDQQELLSWI